MASAQQKPKKDPGVRNSGRRNGKLPKQTTWIERIVTESEPDKQGRIKVDVKLVQRPRMGADGKKLSGRGKPSYNSCLGVGVKRLLAHAKATDSGFTDEVHNLYQQNASKRNWTPEQAKAKADAWLAGYDLKQAMRWSPQP